MNTNKALYEMRPIRDFRDMMNQSAREFANEPAFKLRQPNGEYSEVTYAQFRTEIDALGVAMQERGWLPRKNVAIMGGNSYEWLLTYLAAHIGSGIVVPIDKELYFEDINTILKVSETKLIFVDNKAFSKISEHRDELPAGIEIVLLEGKEAIPGTILFHDLLAHGHELLSHNAPCVAEYKNVEIDPNALAVLSFTSGTSGLTKGVMLSQANICFVIVSNCSVAKGGPGDQYLSVCPIHHTMECTEGILIPLYMGACIAFNDSLLHLMRNLQEVKPTIFVTVPLMLEKFHGRIMQAVSEKKGGRLKLTFGKILAEATNAVGVNMNDRIFEEITKNFGGRLRLIIIGAAAVRPEVIKDFKTFGITSYIGYGMTECAPLIACNHDQLFTIDSVGKPIPGLDVKIINEDSNGIGEICVKGPNVMLGYYKDDVLTKETIDEFGYLHTGDLGSMDEEGILRIHGRIKNVIVTKNGKNIYPEEIEYHLNNNPLIAESMVVGFDNEEENETIVEAKIFPDFEAIKKKYTEKGKDAPTGGELERLFDEIIKDLNKRLPNYKNVKKVTLRDNEFIKTTTMKIKRYANMDDKETPKEDTVSEDNPLK
ncbi:MAG: AMP-binding protein [Clostridia bacterium]|nr:AMP-binding protein [Clostridia bacterium]